MGGTIILGLTILELTIVLLLNGEFKVGSFSVLITSLDVMLLFSLVPVCRENSLEDGTFKEEVKLKCSIEDLKSCLISDIKFNWLGLFYILFKTDLATLVLFVPSNDLIFSASLTL